MTAYYGQRYCKYCGAMCGDENAYLNHLCTPARMAEREERETGINMAAIVICDRDGEIVTAKVAGGAQYWPNPDAGRESYTLCPNCARELYDWFRNEQGNVRAIMAPFDPTEERLPDGPTQAETTRAAITAEYSEDVSKQTRY